MGGRSCHGAGVPRPRASFELGRLRYVRIDEPCACRVSRGQTGCDLLIKDTLAVPMWEGGIDGGASEAAARVDVSTYQPHDHPTDGVVGATTATWL
eukprot:COSAG06_NODE_38749_length_420_cov_0.800623_1_plen_96_part_00